MPGPRLGLLAPLYGRRHRRYRLPVNDHEAMNLDNPGRGPLFPFAAAAAVEHNRWELDMLLTLFGQAYDENVARRFLGRVR